MCFFVEQVICCLHAFTLRFLHVFRALLLFFEHAAQLSALRFVAASGLRMLQVQADDVADAADAEAANAAQAAHEAIDRRRYA